MDSEHSKYGRRVLVTGASSGIGLASAQAFAALGFEVFAASRHPDGARKLPGGGSVTPATMDVTSNASVEAAVAEIGDVDIVVHAAGMGIAGAAGDTPDDAAHAQMETNYFGVLRVNRAVLPAMLANRRGLIVIVGSVASLFPVPFQSHYSSSKAALVAYGRALRLELAGSGVQVAIIEPGDTKTGFTAARVFAIPPGSPFEASCRASVARMEHDEQTGRAPQTVARQIVGCAFKQRPPVRWFVGADYNLLALAGRLLPTTTIDAVLRKMYVK